MRHQCPEWVPMLYRVSRITGDRIGAEDILQTAVLRMAEYSARSPILDQNSFFARVALNLAKDTFKTYRPSGDAERLLEMADREPLQDEVLSSRERLGCVLGRLDTLPRRTRHIFLMHRLDGLKYREIADLERITVSAVEKHIAKASVYISDRYAAAD